MLAAELHTGLNDVSKCRHSETNITTGFGSKSKSASFITHYYFVGLFFAVGASPVLLRTLVVLCYLLVRLKHGIGS